MKISVPLLKTHWILTLLLPCSQVHAQDSSRSLTEVVQTALKNSPQVLKSQSSASEFEAKRIEARGTYLPTLSGSISYLADKKYMLTDISFGGAPVSVPQILPTTTYSLNVQYGLFDGWASTRRYQSADKMQTAAEKELRWSQFRIERETKLQFFKALAAKTLREVAESNVTTLEDHLKDIRLFRKAGVSTNYDVLRVEVQVSEAKSELMNAIDNEMISQTKLAEILGEDGSIAPQGHLPSPPLIQLGAHELSPALKRPDLEALALRAGAMDDLSAAADKHWVPKVSLFGAYQYYNNRTTEVASWDAFREAYQAGVNLTWNFFDGFTQSAKATQALEVKKQTQLSLKQAQLRAKQETDLWRRKYQYFCSTYKSRGIDVEKVQESLRLAKEGRRVGARTDSDLLDVEAELYRAKAGSVTAQLGALESLLNLELSTGENLTKDF